jgi:hypothetical protein
VEVKGKISSMRHYLQYHNPERYGPPQAPKAGEPFYVLTRKAAGRRVAGSAIWLVVGEGRPRSYSLSKVFLADWVGPAGDPDFVHRIAGADGTLFEPPLLLDGYPWFLDMKYRLANFSLGFTEITNTYARYLIALAQQAGVDLSHLTAGST